MGQNTNEPFVQVSEDGLQDIAGGCINCANMTIGMVEQQTDALNNALKDNSFRAGHEKERAKNLGKLIESATNTINVPPPAGRQNCKSYFYHTREFAKHIRL